MQGVEWIGAMIAAAAGAAGVMYFGAKEFSSHDNDDRTDGRGD